LIENSTSPCDRALSLFYLKNVDVSYRCKAVYFHQIWTFCDPPFWTSGPEWDR